LHSLRFSFPSLRRVAGYFGVVPGSLLKQVGRGYTDLCAALIAVGLKAAELQIWKEVDGIFSADPRKVPTARLIPIITPDEAAELTYYGSEVIHPFTMEQVIRASIPIRIKNVENPTGSGTVIYPETSAPIDGEGGTGAEVAQPRPIKKFPEHLPTAVTIKDSIIIINIHSNRKTISHGFLARIFGTLDRFGVIVDLISTSEVHVSMAIHADLMRKDIEKMVKELKKIGTVRLLVPCQNRSEALVNLSFVIFSRSPSFAIWSSSRSSVVSRTWFVLSQPCLLRSREGATDLELPFPFFFSSPGRYLRSNVHYPRRRPRQHRDDLPRSL
jgi:hypothetical protein